MTIVEAIVKIVWRNPEEELPETDGQYYAILKNSRHRLVSFTRRGGWGGYQWAGDTGFSSDVFMNEEIECWTELISNKL